MKIPKGVNAEGKEGWCWRLRKSLYGLKQSEHQWKKKLDEVMKELGFEKANADECLYILREDGKISLLVLVYVDDMALASNSMATIRKFKDDLSKHFNITDLGDLHIILGIQVTHDRPNGIIYLDQTAYIQSVLSRFGMQDCNPVSTPLNLKERPLISQCPTNEDEKTTHLAYAKGLNYLEVISSILYATQTHPDLQYAVGTLAQFGSNPGIPHLNALKCVLRYLKGTAHFKLKLGGTDKDVSLIGWTDSDWAGDVDTRRSVGGFSFEVAGGFISWSSKKQPTVALSTIESEYMAAANATREAIWLRILLTDLGYPQVSASIVYGDNQGCISLTRNPIAHSHAKHIDIRHHFIRERIENKEVDLQYCSTKEMIADIFTKPLARETFVKFRAALGVGEF